jgi:hypothetical protein
VSGSGSNGWSEDRQDANESIDEKALSSLLSSDLPRLYHDVSLMLFLQATKKAVWFVHVEFRAR